MDERSTAPAGDPGAAEVTASAPALGRRALLRAGASAAPVLLTLASRPVSASNSCVVASSFVSVATFHSRNPTRTTAQCTTRTCEDWHRDACLPTSGSPSRPSYLNNTVASLLSSTSSSYNSSALWTVLKNDPYGIVTSGELGALQHLVSLTLSVQKGFAAVPGNVSVPYLQAVWKNFIANGRRYRLPASGIDWGSTELISWLRMLMYPIPV